MEKKYNLINEHFLLEHQILRECQTIQEPVPVSVILGRTGMLVQGLVVVINAEKLAKMVLRQRRKRLLQPLQLLAKIDDASGVYDEIIYVNAVGVVLLGGRCAKQANNLVVTT